MRILFVSQYYPPETGAAPMRAALLVEALRARGHQVTVLTGIPNHPSGVVADGFKGVWRREEACGVVRRWLYASPKKGLIRRLANQISFGASVMLELRGSLPYDAVVATVPPPFLGSAAAWATRRRGVPFVVDVRDDWPRAAIRLGMLKDGMVARVLGRVVTGVYDAADRLVVVTPGMERWFRERGVAAERLSLVTNGADMNVYGSVPAAVPREDCFTVMYAGTHGIVHGMDVIVEAAERLRDRSVRFVLIGDGVVKERLQQRVAEAGLTNVEFRPSMPPADLALAFAEADAFVVTTTADEFCGETIPVKLFDYLAAGRPVIGALLGDAANVLEASGGGIVVPPENSEALAQAVIQLESDGLERGRMSMAGREYVTQTYSREALGSTFAQAVEATAARCGHHGRQALPSGIGGVVKRTIDVVGSGVGLLLLSPVLVVVALVIKIDSPGPVLFRQRRSGRWGKEFLMYKFRTMRTDTPDVATHLLGDPGAFLTRSGAFLRRTSIDELPQLFNVLFGDMSLVGPRPALYNQYDLIEMRQQADADTLRPGITGWAQVNGRDDVEMDVKVGLDAAYLRRAGLFMDLTILFRTVIAVFSQRGAR